MSRDVLKLPLLNNFNFSNETLMDLVYMREKNQENLEQALKQKTSIPFKWGTAKGEKNLDEIA